MTSEFKYVIDSGQPLSRSLLWAIQRRYYEDRGVDAWRTNIVPSYVTSNPYIARSYARVVLGYIRDCLPDLDRSQPIYLLELGTGAGRFSYYFMRCFEDLLAQTAFPDLDYCYVMTDMPERNLAFWQEHPAFQDWAALGKLDFARFDALADRGITLRQSGQMILPDVQKNPLILMANYFFDSLPQDAFHVEKGRLQECLIELTSKQEEPDLNAIDVLMRLKIHSLTQEGDSTGYYQDPDLDAVLEQYRVLDNSYLLFPADAIRLLRNLRKLANENLFFLCGDYGPTSVHEWDHNGAPDIRIHGSISMEVNFHALGAVFENAGGHYLAPHNFSKYLTICAFFIGENSGQFSETNLAYSEVIERSGPNDFFLLKRGMERSYPILSVDEVNSFLRFSGWDPHLFLDIFPTLLDKLSSADLRDQEELAQAMVFLWENYYHLGEERDLPFCAGVVLFRLGFTDEALLFFERSLDLYGASPMTLYNIALCQKGQRKFGLARARLKQALAVDPEFEPAILLLEDLNKGRKNNAGGT